jgi:protein gp37
MAKTSGISWTHSTWNPWLGCDKIAPECAHCYIDRMLRKLHRAPWGTLYQTKTWGDPAKWQSEMPSNKARRVFTCSESDFFHVKADAWRPGAWDVIRDTPNLVYLILTKRPERIAKHLPPGWPYRNVWLGVSTGCQQTLNKMDTLRRIPVHPEAVRFISAEPLLESLMPEIDLDGFGWVIAGGESGSDPEYKWNRARAFCYGWKEELDFTEGRRYMEIKWAEELRDECIRRGIPFLFKQATAGPDGQGSNLLGRIWQQYPKPPKGLTWAKRARVELRHKWKPVQIQDYKERVA